MGTDQLWHVCLAYTKLGSQPKKEERRRGRQDRRKTDENVREGKKIVKSVSPIDFFHL